MASKVIFSVSRLNEYANSVLSNDVRLHSVRVEGELSGFKRHSSGHLYFYLKDDAAVIRCVMFKSSAAGLRFLPRDGLRVIVSGSVSIYVRDGQYQLYAVSMRESGEGELYRQFLELRDKLEAQGLFAQKRRLPFLPKCVGVITSDSGAAYHDIVTTVRRRFPTMNIAFANASVQGVDAPGELIRAIELMNTGSAADVLIIARGGGSYEDLFCFNDEALAISIYNSRIPTISAVGHEVDFTIVDFVADLRAPTPTAAAELCVPRFDSLLDAAVSGRERLRSAVKSQLNAARSRFDILRSSSAMLNPERKTERTRIEINACRRELLMAAGTAITAAYSRNDAARAALETLNPAGVLRRGYALILSEEKEYISSAEQLREGRMINIRMFDGSASAQIRSTETTEDNG